MIFFNMVTAKKLLSCMDRKVILKSILNSHLAKLWIGVSNRGSELAVFLATWIEILNKRKKCFQILVILGHHSFFCFFYIVLDMICRSFKCQWKSCNLMQIFCEHNFLQWILFRIDRNWSFTFRLFMRCTWGMEASRAYHISWCW